MGLTTGWGWQYGVGRMGAYSWLMLTPEQRAHVSFPMIQQGLM